MGAGFQVLDERRYEVADASPKDGSGRMPAATARQDRTRRSGGTGHRLNILSSAFRHVGIAVYLDSSGTVWMTQDFSN